VPRRTIGQEPRPESIENRWDILYRDYPEVYDEFASTPYNPPLIDVIHDKFDLDGRTIADIGSGSGIPTFELARFASSVTGVEPEESMRDLAEKKAEELGITNVRFVEGRAEAIPFDDNSVEMVTAFFASLYPPGEIAPRLIAEASRVVKPQGLVLVVDVAPGWYGGELASIIKDNEADTVARALHRIFVEDGGFSYVDVEQVQEFGSLEKIVSTYGFIFGREAIDHLRTHRKTSVKWHMRMFHKTIE
jgi:ubiquinone/menaquinone biosynthesis C-methylase UbiE